jgi:hypothetical protein
MTGIETLLFFILFCPIVSEMGEALGDQYCTKTDWLLGAV